MKKKILHLTDHYHIEVLPIQMKAKWEFKHKSKESIKWNINQGSCSSERTPRTKNLKRNLQKQPNL